MFWKQEKGVMTLDAALGLMFSVFLFFTVVTTALTLKTELYLQQVLLHATKETAYYSYLLTKTQQKELSKEVGELVNYALTFANGVQQGKKQLETLTTFDKNQVTDLEGMTKENVLNGVISMKNNRYVTQAVAKYLFKQYIPGNSDTSKNQFLKNMGVLGGLEGISFAGSFLHAKKRTSDITPKDMYVTLEISYRLRGMYYHQFDYHHTIKNSITLKVKTGG